MPGATSGNTMTQDGPQPSDARLAAAVFAGYRDGEHPRTPNKCFQQVHEHDQRDGANPKTPIHASAFIGQDHGSQDGANLSTPIYSSQGGANPNTPVYPSSFHGQVRVSQDGANLSTPIYYSQVVQTRIPQYILLH